MSETEKGRLLVVDDDKVNRLILGRYLEREGHQVMLAVNGKEAIEQLTHNNFDMILLDIEMPVMNGYQVLEYARKDPLLRDIPIIVTSGLEEMNSVVRCVQMGAEDYLTKPVNQVLLKARIDASLEKKFLRDKQASLLKQLERELDIARETQMSILPNTIQQPEGYAIGALIIPARSVGGDFYDVIHMGDDQWGLLLGDVSDKGLPAALFMTLTYSLLKVEALRGNPPGLALTNVNSYLMGMNSDSMFVTVVCGLLDPKTHQLAFARAGHPSPLIGLKTGEVLTLPKRPSRAIGLFEEACIDEDIVTIPRDGLVLFFSDGLSEAMDSNGTQFGEARLASVLRECHDLPPQKICEFLWDQVKDFCGESAQQDDFTVLVLKRNR